MSLPRTPFENRSIILTSASSAATYNPPIGWVQVAAAGAVVMVAENGDAVSFPLAACPAGAVLRGPFAGFTSTGSFLRPASVSDGVSLPSRNFVMVGRLQ